MAATAQAQAEAAKAAQRAGIDHKRSAAPQAYLGRKPSYTRQQLDRVLSALSSASAPSLSSIARAEGLTKQTVYRIKANHKPQRLRWACKSRGSQRDQWACIVTTPTYGRPGVTAF
jgi:DNA invertase Pin-like site-specific DNA recombinase